jgi:hypothetical protein
VKRDVDTVLTYPAVMGSVFCWPFRREFLSASRSWRPASRGLRRGGTGDAEKPRDRSEYVTRRIPRQRGEGRTYQSVANGLRADGIPT